MYTLSEIKEIAWISWEGKRDSSDKFEERTSEKKGCRSAKMKSGQVEIAERKKVDLSPLFPFQTRPTDLAIFFFSRSIARRRRPFVIADDKFDGFALISALLPTSARRGNFYFLNFRGYADRKTAGRELQARRLKEMEHARNVSV